MNKPKEVCSCGDWCTTVLLYPKHMEDTSIGYEHSIQIISGSLRIFIDSGIGLNLGAAQIYSELRAVNHLLFSL